MPAPTNTILSTDLAPAISIDVMIPVAEGSIIQTYTTTVGDLPAQVAEGEVIPLTKVTRTPAEPLTLPLGKYRKSTTAEAIQKSGYDVAINNTDEALVRRIRGEVKTKFYNNISTGTGTATGGSNLQQTLSNLWAALKTRYEDYDASPIYFINPVDVANYLGNAQITTQNAFGFDYVENFLSLGTAIFAPNIPQGTVYATVKENLRGAYIPGGSAVATAFQMVADESGLVLITHDRETENATIDTLIFMSVLFYAEYVDGVFKATITPGV